MDVARKSRKKRKLDLLVNWGESVEKEDEEEREGIRQWLVSKDVVVDTHDGCSLDMEVLVSDQTKQVSIRNFTMTRKELCRRMVEGWVAGDMIDLVWEELEVSREIRECISMLEMNDNMEEIPVPEECPDVRVEKEDDEVPGSILKRKPTKKKAKVLSKKEQKQKAFEKVLMKTKSITSWLKMPPTVEVHEDVDVSLEFDDKEKLMELFVVPTV